jgi:hypothetical protein
LRNLFGATEFDHVESSQTLSKTKQHHNSMKHVYNIIIASALIAAAHAQAPEGKPERKGPPGGPPAEIIAKFDKDGDGKLNDEERAAARAEFEAKRKEAQAKFDTDGDGKLSEDERKAMQEARKKEMLEKFDKDGDGKLSEEERKAAGPQRGGPGRPGGPKGGGKGGRPPGK